jgi:molecular chaperone HtpG
MLCLTDNVDEFALRMLMKYDDKEFRNISADDLELESAEEKEKTQALAEENKDLLAFVKDALGDKVKDVRVSGKLKSHPVCITTDGMISTEMEKVINAMPAQEKIKAQRVLEINGEHPIFQRLQELYAKDKDRLKLYAEVLYDQALLIEGISLEDPSDFSQKLCQLL